MRLAPPNCYVIAIYIYGQTLTYYWCHDQTMLSNSACRSILDIRRVYEDNDCEQSVIKTRKLYNDDGIIVFPPNVSVKFEGDIIGKRKRLLYEIEEHVYEKKQEEKRIARGRKNTKSARAV